jgi:hypothetical protein
MEPKEGAKARTRAAASFSQAIRKSTMRYEKVWPLVHGLSALAPPLEPTEARAMAAALTQVINSHAPADVLPVLAEGLLAVSDRLEPKERSKICSPLATSLANTLGKTTNIYAPALANILSVVATRLEPREAASVCAEAAASLIQTINKKKRTDIYDVPALAHSLSAVVVRVDPLSQCQRAVGVVSMPWDWNGPLCSLPWLCLAVEPPPCRLSTLQLVELLKNPLCVGDARRVVLTALSDRYREQFASQWEFVRFAQDQNLEERLALDFTSPPKRPATPPAAPQ